MLLMSKLGKSAMMSLLHTRDNMDLVMYRTALMDWVDGFAVNVARGKTESFLQIKSRNFMLLDLYSYQKEVIKSGGPTATRN